MLAGEALEEDDYDEEEEEDEGSDGEEGNIFSNIANLLEHYFINRIKLCNC